MRRETPPLEQPFLLAFGIVLYTAGNRFGDVMGPRLQDLESASSP